MNVVVIRAFSCYLPGDLLNPADDVAIEWVSNGWVASDEHHFQARVERNASNHGEEAIYPLQSDPYKKAA